MDPTELGPRTLHRLPEVLAGPPSALPDPGRRAAAVLIPLFLDGLDLRVVLTKRTAHLRRHRGEVSFPGGASEPADDSLQATALRETSEEIGLHPEDVRVIGVLRDMPTAGSGYVIRPFVGEIPAGYGFVADAHEVERIFTPRLAEFADPALRRDETWERDGIRYPVTFFDVGGEVVWGATARMLVELLDLIAGRPTAPLPPIPVPREG